MRIPQSGLRVDSPSFPLLQGLISYWGVTDANGNALGTTVVCGNLANEPSYDGLPVKILNGPAAGQMRTIQVHAGGTLTVGVAFSNAAGGVQQITAGTLFVILSSLGGGGGPGPAPTEGLSYYGVVDAVPGANQFTIGSLAGLGAGKFDGATNPYYAFVLRDAGGAGAAPQGEQQAITAYVTATGTFTTPAFTAAVAVGDEILILHPDVASVLVILAGLAVPGIDSVINLLMRDVVGNKADTIPAMNLAPAATDSLVRHVKAIMERVGATPADPDDSVLTNLGQRDDAATLDDMSDITTTSIEAKLRRILTRMSPDAFTATIMGAARTELDTILAQLAVYFKAAGAAFNPTIFGAARADVSDALQSLAVYFKAAAAAYSATVGGVARADVESSMTALAAYFNAASVALAVTIDNGGAARSNLNDILNDLGQILGGANGITTWRARALPANTVSLAEGLRYIAEVKPEWNARASASHVTASGAEETILTTAYTVPGLFYFNLTLRNMVAGDDFTIRVYKRVDGVNYDLKSEQNFIDAPLVKIYEIEDLYSDGTEFISVRIQRNSGTNRAFPYSLNFLSQPVA